MRLRNSHVETTCGWQQRQWQLGHGRESAARCQWGFVDPCVAVACRFIFTRGSCSFAYDTEFVYLYSHFGDKGRTGSKHSKRYWSTQGCDEVWKVEEYPVEVYEEPRHWG